MPPIHALVRIVWTVPPTLPSIKTMPIAPDLSPLRATSTDVPTFAWMRFMSIVTPTSSLERLVPTISHTLGQVNYRIWSIVLCLVIYVSSIEGVCHSLDGM